MYRDDHDALLARAESLERSLADSKEALEDKSERLDETSAELKAREKELASVRRRLAKLKRPAGGNKQSVFIIISLALVFVSGAALVLMANESKPEPPMKAEETVSVSEAPKPPRPKPQPLPQTIPARVIDAALDRATPALQACAEEQRCSGVVHLSGRITLIGKWEPVPTGTRVRVKVKATTKANSKSVESQTTTDTGNPDFSCPTESARILATECMWSTLAVHPLGSSMRGALFTRDISIAAPSRLHRDE